MKKLFLFFILLYSNSFSSTREINEIISETVCHEVYGTGSMRPSFDEKSWLLVKQIPFEDVRIGDVVIYKVEKPYILNGNLIEEICHRVIRKSSGGSWLITKGDNNPEEDKNPTTERNYMGTVVAIVRRE